MDLKSKIFLLDQKIESLEKQFNQYFTGQERRPPARALESLKREVMKLIGMADSIINTGDRFAVQTFIQKFTTYRTKWERGMTMIEDGRVKPGINFFGGGTYSPPVVKKPQKRDPVADAAEKYVDLSKKFEGKNYNAKAVELKLREKMHAVREKYGDRYVLDVYYDGERVKIRTLKRSDDEA